MSVATVLAKTAGAVGIGLIGYDAHYAGKLEGSAYANDKKSTALSERFRDDMKLESVSMVKSGVKRSLFNYDLDENLSGFFTSMVGYLKGASKILVGNVVPLALSAGAILTKGLASKVCGAGLLAYGGIFLLQEIFGIGKPKE